MKGWSAALRAVLATFAVVAMSGTAAAQSSTSGDIQGVVRDPGGAPVVGATVVANGPQGARASTTDATGTYLIEFLTPGAYDVTATAQGFQPVTQRAVQVRLGTRVTLNLSLSPMAETEETVTITAAAPTVDTTTTSISTNIGSDLIGNIPTSRTFTGLVALAPGVVDPGDPVLGSNNPSISGASGLENQYVVNGVNITNQGYGSLGAYSGRYGSLGTGVNFDFIDAVQVKSAGFEAEYGEALGGIINVTTKRGTNEYHGSVFFNTQPEQLESSRRRLFLEQSEWATADIVGTATTDVGATVGGPIIKDKAFFFAAINPSQSSTIRRAPAGFALSELGRETTRRTRNAYAGTLNWNVVDNHSLELSLFGDPSTSDFGPQAGSELLATSQARYSTLRFGSNNQILRYNGVFGSFMSAEATVSHAKDYFEQSFPASSDQYQVTDRRGGGVIRSGGLGFYERAIGGENTEYRLKLTNYLTAAGRHEIKYGASFQDVSFTADNNRTGAPGGTFVDPETGTVYTYTTGVSVTILDAMDGTDVYRVTRGLYSSPKVTATTEYTALFLQDKWSPTPTLTVDLGVRLDQQQLGGGGPGAGKYTFKFQDNIQPRLGASWDFTGRGRGKVYAHAGRYVEKIPLDIALRALSTELSVTRVDYFSDEYTADNQIPEGTVPVEDSDGNPDTVHFINPGSEPTQIDKGTKSQYQDELTLGVEYEPVETINVGLRYIHRELGRVLEDYLIDPNGNPAIADLAMQDPDAYDGVAYVIGNPGSQFNKYCYDGYENCWADPSRVYDALELTVEKRLTSNWQMLASYRLSRLFGNYEGNFKNDNGQDDPNISSTFDYANNSPLLKNQGKGGVLPTDRTHVLKVHGSYLTAVGLNVGASYNVQTGTPKSKFAAHPLYTNSGEVPLAGRGALGRHPTTHQIDLHFDYGIPVRSGMDLKAMVDIFNLLDSQEIVATDMNFENTGPVANPEFGKPIRYQAPRAVRLGLRLAF